MLYSNDAFSEIFRTNDVNLGIDLELLKIKAEEGVDLSLTQRFMVHDKPLFSISNLLQERIEVVSNTILSIERTGEAHENDRRVRRAKINNLQRSLISRGLARQENSFEP